MDFKEIQKKVIETALDYGREYNIKIDTDFALLKLYEELGEFSQAVLIHKRKSKPEKYISDEASKKELAKELADVFGTIIVNAHLLNIDLEDAVNKKWITREWINKNN